VLQRRSVEMETADIVYHVGEGENRIYNRLINSGIQISSNTVYELQCEKSILMVSLEDYLEDLKVVGIG